MTRRGILEMTQRLITSKAHEIGQTLHPSDTDEK